MSRRFEAYIACAIGWVFGALAYALIAHTLGGCAQIEIASDTVEHTGTVCMCSDGIDRCYAEDSCDELGGMLGQHCDPIDFDEHAWAWLTNALSLGCYYECPPKHLGCNATGGCYCPPEE